jgi:5-methylcytosine-specific restriction endonuclease McrA
MSARPAWKRGWEAKRLQILRRDRFLCQTCIRAKRFTAATAVDHINARSSGGDESPENLEAICPNCHEVKSKREANANYREPTRVAVDGAPDGWR